MYDYKRKYGYCASAASYLYNVQHGTVSIAVSVLQLLHVLRFVYCTCLRNSGPLPADLAYYVKYSVTESFIH